MAIAMNACGHHGATVAAVWQPLDPETVYILVACVGLVALWAVVVALLRVRRRGALRKLAAELGFSYSRAQYGDADEEVDEKIRQGLETGLAFDNVMTGAVGEFRVEIYDQTLSQILCGSSMTSQTVIDISREGLETPEFILQPESRVAQGFRLLEGGSALKFGGDMSFSRRNYLRGSEKETMQAAFDLEVRTLLQNNKRLWIQATGSSYRFYEYGSRMSAGRLRTALEQALAIVRAFCAAQGTPDA